MVKRSIAVVKPDIPSAWTKAASLLERNDWNIFQNKPNCKCGKSVFSTDKFCPHCGSRLRKGKEIPVELLDAFIIVADDAKNQTKKKR